MQICRVKRNPRRVVLTISIQYLGRAEQAVAANAMRLEDPARPKDLAPAPIIALEGRRQRGYVAALYSGWRVQINYGAPKEIRRG